MSSAFSIIVRPRKGQGVVRWFWLPAVFGLWMASSASALTPEVRDEGAFFSATAIKKANTEVASIKKKFNKDFFIETFASVPADKAESVKKMDRRARNEFYEHWADERAHDSGVEGVYVLITKNPEHLQVLVGRVTQKRVFTLRDRDGLRDVLLGAFKKKEYDRGLLEAVQFVDDTMAKNHGTANRGRGTSITPPANQVVEHPVNRGVEHVPAPGQAQQHGSAFSVIIWLLIIGVIMWIVISIVRAIARSMFGGGGYGRGAGPAGPMGGGYGYGGGGGGGGFMGNMLGGLFGAAAGSWLYDSFLRGGGGGGWGNRAYGGDDDRRLAGGGSEGSDVDQGYSGSGGDFDSGQSDSGGGGDFGGGGGDFGGGGGDFGGGGGGDFGGGGGDFGGGGGGGDF